MPAGVVAITTGPGPHREAGSAARAASTSSIRAAKRESDAPRTAIERHEAARSSLYAMRYEVATRPEEKQ